MKCDAEWFAERWEAHGALGHLRRLHYRLVSGEEQVLLPDGKPYVNDEYSFDWLVYAGAKARHLGKVDAQEFVDRRNPDPIINIGPARVRARSERHDRGARGAVAERAAERAQPVLAERWLLQHPPADHHGL